MPDVAIAVASHDRPLGLRWLLNALEEQTLAPERFQVVVAHDAAGAETGRLLAEHPLGAAGRLRAQVMAGGLAGPAAKRNAAWRGAEAPLIAFTDERCRPREDWLERLLAGASGRPDVVVQGSTRPDPEQLGLLRGAPWAHSAEVEPPTVWGETCNIAYPRALLEHLGGFDHRLPGLAGQDADLLARARARGAGLVAAPGAVVYHAVDTPWLGRRLRSNWSRGQLAAVVRRHPELRRALPGRIWWKPEHPALALAAAGGALALRRRRRHRGAARRPVAPAALAAPWLALALRHRGYGLRGLSRSTLELPGRAAVEASEVAALAWGSLRHRSLLL